MTFIVKYTQSLGVSPEALFNWKLLLIGIVSAKEGDMKKRPHLTTGPGPALPHWQLKAIFLAHFTIADPIKLHVSSKGT